MSSRVRRSRQTLWFCTYSWMWWMFFQLYITLFRYIEGEMRLSVCTHWDMLTVTMYHSRCVFLNWYSVVLETDEEKSFILYVPRCCQQEHSCKMFTVSCCTAIYLRTCTSGVHLCGSWQKHSEGSHFLLWWDDNWGVSMGPYPEPLLLVCRN